MLLLLRFVTGHGILLFQADTYLMFYQRKSVLFSDEHIFLKSSCNFISQSFLTLRNLLFFTKSMRSSSNGINSLSCGGYLLLFKPYTEPLAQDSVVSLLLFMKKIAFHRNFFINNSIFSISCSLQIRLVLGCSLEITQSLLFPFD